MKTSHNSLKEKYSYGWSHNEKLHQWYMIKKNLSVCEEEKKKTKERWTDYMEDDLRVTGIRNWKRLVLETTVMEAKPHLRSQC